MLRDNLAGLIEPMRIQKQASDDRSSCLENPRPVGAEFSLTENVTSPFQAEPAHLFEEEFLQAVILTLENAFESEGKKVPGDLSERVQKSWETRKSIPERPEKRPKSEKDEKDERKTAGKWFKDLAKEVLGDEASKVVLARTYAEQCRQLKNPNPNRERVKDARAICKEIASKLKLPPLKAASAIEVVP
jgi:hypothetical protein